MAQAMGALVKASLRYQFDSPKRAKPRRKPARTAVIPSQRVYRMTPEPSLGRVHVLRPIKPDQRERALGELRAARVAAVRGPRAKTFVDIPYPTDAKLADIPEDLVSIADLRRAGIAS